MAARATARESAIRRSRIQTWVSNGLGNDVRRFREGNFGQRMARGSRHEHSFARFCVPFFCWHGCANFVVYGFHVRLRESRWLFVSLAKPAL